MAKSVSKKKKSKVKKSSNVFRKIVLVIFILAFLCFAGYVGVTYYPTSVEENEKIVNVEKYLQDNITLSVNDNITLPTKVNGYESISITWSSSDEATLSTLGVVNAPAFDQKAKTVKLIATYNVITDDSLANFVYSLFKVNGKKTEFIITVNPSEATPLEKINYVKAKLYVPSVTASDIGLVTIDSIFNSVNISWSSSNESILSSSGIKKGEGNVTLKATLSCEDKTGELSFDVNVKNKIDDITSISMNFDNLNSGTYSTIWEASSWRFTNAILATDNSATVDPDAISEQEFNVCRLKAENGTASIESLEYIENPRNISFNYEIYAGDKKTSYTKDTVIRIYYSTGAEWVLINTTSPLGSDKYNYSYDLSSVPTNSKFKIEVFTQYASMRVDIDNVKITRGLSSNDVISWVKANTLTNYLSSTILPLTTAYGGVISWQTNSTYLSNTGVVVRPEETQTIDLVATIKGFGEDITTTIKVTVPSNNSSTPVEIYFIDLGKYGQSDCGESIYIKYEDIEILVDAGDDITASKQAVKELIDLHSEDKIIEYLVATHPDSDHIGGMESIFENYQILNLIQFSGDHTTNLYKEYVSSYEKEECTVCTALDSYNNVGNCKRIIEIAPEVRIEIINTNNYLGKETNTRSVVFVLEAYGVRTLLTGDADNGSNSNLESEYMNTVGNIDILKAVHHATKEGTTTAFLEAVDPEVVIITNGNYFGNKHGHPTPYAINRIYQYDSSINIYAVVGGDSEECEVTSSGAYKCEVEDPLVDRNGTIKIVIDNNGYTISSEYYNDNPLELSDTNFWKNNPLKEAEHN